MALANILQFVEIEKRTSIIEVSSETRGNGVFYFHMGVLYDASYGDLQGEAAALEMISWDNVQIQFTPIPHLNMDRRISSELASLILKGVKGSGKRNDGRDAIESAILQQEINDWPTHEVEREDDVHIDADSAITGESKDHYGDSRLIHKEKEGTMDVQKLNEAIEIEKRDLGEGLLATDIFSSSDGQSVAGYNTNPQACALFNKITGDLSDSLVGSGFPGLGRYYILDLVDGKMVVVIPLGDYQWGMLIDTKKVQLGLLLNVVMPKMINAFEEAITG